MAERKFNFALGEYYHIYNRGNSKQEIFFDDSDYRRFQRLLFLANSSDNFKIEYIQKSGEDFYEVKKTEELVAIGAYCLMPNHFHILLTPLVEDGVSNFMRKLGTGYSMYFNKKYERTGSLFEGKFKSRLADTDEYLKYLFAYIHMNPLKLIDPDWKEYGVRNQVISMEYLLSYEYSSFYDWCTHNRREIVILHKNAFPEYFITMEDVENSVLDWFGDRKDL